MASHRTILLLCLIAAGTSGCASNAYQSLVSEDEVPSLATLKDRAIERETMVHLVPTAISDGRDVTLAVHETGNPNADRTVVFLHGVMSDHRAWRFVSGDLGADHRLLMVDLPGSGQSDRPHPDDLGPEGYGPDALAERALQALAAVTGDDPAPRSPITLVGHSLGGTIALRMHGRPQFRERYRALLDRVDRMVLLAPADVEIESPGRVLQQMAEVSGLEVLIGDVTGILQSRVASGARESVNDPDWALREEADRICAMLTDNATRRAHQAMLRQARPLSGDGALDREAVRQVVSGYARVDVPCLIVWGARDTALPVSMGYKLMHQIPESELYIVDDCRHSLQLEHPAHCAAIIRRFGSTGSFDLRAEHADRRVYTANVGD